LRIAMRVRGLTKLSAMAAAVGVTESAISRWCHDGPMTIENVVVVCAVLEMSIDWFLLGRGDMDQHHADMLASHPPIARAIARMKPHAREYLSRFLSSVQEDASDR